MAHISVCRRQGEANYVDDAFGLVEIDVASPDWALDQSWDYYTKYSPHIEWFDADKRECRRWMHAALEFNGGQYDPRNLHVITPEQRFDLTIEHDWAHYHYELPDGQVLDGQLGLRGTIDLIVQDPDPAVIHIIDWKTGKRKDWSKEGYEKKSYKDIRHDPQLCLYHYAVCQLYPEAEEVFVTIFYINDGGPYSLCFEKRDLEYTERLIRRKFDRIRQTRVPHLNIGRKCTSFCFFGKNMSDKDPTKTICQYVADRVKADGIERVMKEEGTPNAFLSYGSGGGRRGEV